MTEDKRVDLLTDEELDEQLSDALRSPATIALTNRFEVVMGYSAANFIDSDVSKRVFALIREYGTRHEQKPKVNCTK